MALLTIATSNIPPALPPIGFIFKLNPLPDDVTPFLVPVLDNPNFNILKANPPGIKQIVSGDLGITEAVYSKVLDPSVAALAVPTNTVPVVPTNAGGSGKAPATQSNVLSPAPASNTLGIKAPPGATVAQPSIPPIGNSAADVSAKFSFPSAGASLSQAQKAFVNNAVPQDAGLKSFEKMTIQSLLESQKPALELAQILIGMLAVIEDCICRFLGTSIKIPIINLWVGIPSKNPTYTKGSLNYNAPGAMNASYIKNMNAQAINQVNPSFPATADYGGIPGDSITDFPEVQDPQLAYYVGYFDEDGAQVLPPTWVINSNKWFGKKYSIQNDVQQVEQLSSDLDQGVVQLNARYANQLKQLDDEKSTMVTSYDQQIALQTNDVDKSLVTSDKEYALAQYDEIRQSAVDGMNQNVYSEWFTKNSVAQLKSLYQQPFISSVTPVTDDAGNPVYPYSISPTITINGLTVEIPVFEASNQLTKKNEVVNGEVKSVDTVVLQPNTSKVDIVKPNLDLGAPVNYFSHKKPDGNLFVANPTSENIKKYYVPLQIKKYFLDWDYEIIYEYQIKSIGTGKVLATEFDAVPARIQFEKDYTLRLIRVNNLPLAGQDAQGQPIVNSDFYIGTATTSTTDSNGIVTTSTSSFFKTASQVSVGSIDPNTGTALDSGNDIPPNYVANAQGLTYSPNVLDFNNGLMEGEVFHGLDPRFVDPFRFKSFWLVEAIKKDDNGNTFINGKQVTQPSDSSNSTGSGGGGKQWYGLLDKFTVIPRLLGGLLPLITRKFLPLLVKIIQILTNPTKIIQLVNLIVQDKLNKFFKMFNNGSVKDSNSIPPPDQAVVKTKTGDKNASTGAAGKFNYKDGKGNTTNVLDGKASANILIADVGLISKNGEVTVATGSQVKSSKMKDQPVLKFILNLIKMPFDIIKKIIEYFIGLVKKLLNPFTLLPTIVSFITFQWLIDILSPSRVTGVLGNIDPRFMNPDTSLENDLHARNSAVDPNKLFQEMQASLRTGSGDVEVFVYHLFKNGIFVGEEIDKVPLNDPNALGQNGPPPTGFDGADVSGIDVNPDNLTGSIGNAERPTQSSPTSCGARTIDLNKMLPLPFMSNMPHFNKCEAMQIFLKPMQIVVSILKLIEQIINALISIPLSMLGLEPHITFPKLNFASGLESYVNGLQNKFKQTTVPPISKTVVPV